ncbi:hypothetical protein V6N13_103806 [Hibiscus sabdariffa]
MAESGTLSSDSPLTAAEKKASKDWVLENNELKEELILIQREISAQFLNVVNRFEAENKTLRVDLSAALSENAKLKARLSLRQQQTDAASASYRETFKKTQHAWGPHDVTSFYPTPSFSSSSSAAIDIERTFSPFLSHLNSKTLTFPLIRSEKRSEMSWLKLKTAVSKAVEAGNSSNITRNLKNYADTVVQHAGREEQGKGSNPTSKDNLQSYMYI